MPATGGAEAERWTRHPSGGSRCAERSEAREFGTTNPPAADDGHDATEYSTESPRAAHEPTGGAGLPRARPPVRDPRLAAAAGLEVTRQWSPRMSGSRLAAPAACRRTTEPSGELIHGRQARPRFDAGAR